MRIMRTIPIYTDKYPTEDIHMTELPALMASLLLLLVAAWWVLRA